MGAVLRPEGDDDERPGLRQNVDPRGEKRLTGPVHPVKIFEHDDERLYLTFPEEQALDAVKRALAALRRLQALPLGILDRDVIDEQRRPADPALASRP